MNQRQPRKHDKGYLAWLRLRPCLTCGKPPPSDAAHIRSACPDVGKPYTGMAEKPDDRWAVPLCRGCHERQHRLGEILFWMNAGRNPFWEAKNRYEQYGGDGGKPKAPRKIKPRKPKDKRAKIRSRGFPKMKRRFGR